MLIEISAEKTVAEAAASLQAAVQVNHFGVMQVLNLRETMVKKGVEFAHDCLIYEVCQPEQAKKLLEENMGVSTALPCRISVYEKDGKTILATLKPTILLALFNAPALRAVAQDVEDVIVKIMKEAAAAASVATSLPNKPTLDAVKTLAGTELGFRTNSARLKKRLLALAATLHSARRIGEAEELIDVLKVKWHQEWNTLEGILEKIVRTVSELDQAIGSPDTDHLTTATSVWEKLEAEDDALGEILAEIRTLAGEMSVEARTKWNLLAGPLETDLRSIHACAQSLRLKLELLQENSSEQVDQLLDQVVSQLRKPSLHGEAEPYDHQYRKAVIELGREQHEFHGLLDAVKGLASWAESPAERVRKNRSLAVDEHDVVFPKALAAEKSISH
jgi:uncharacterized protein (DUF302 family)